MTYATLINFLAQNPWVLAACALVTLWPITKATLRIVSRLISWLDSATFGKIKLSDDTARKCIESTSYFLAIVVLYTGYIALLIWTRHLSNEIQGSLKSIDSSTMITISKFLLGYINVNSSVLIGAILGELLRLAIVVKRSFEAGEKL